MFLARNLEDEDVRMVGVRRETLCLGWRHVAVDCERVLESLYDHATKCGDRLPPARATPTQLDVGESSPAKGTGGVLSNDSLADG